MSDVIDLNSRRRDRAIQCPNCGSEYFKIVAAINENSEIDAWTGEPECDRCGTVVLPDTYPDADS